MDDVERKYWIAFSKVPRIGRVRFSQLEEHFGRLEEAWRATAGELRAAGLDPGTVSACTAARTSVDPDAEWSGWPNTACRR